MTRVASLHPRPCRSKRLRHYVRVATLRLRFRAFASSRTRAMLPLRTLSVYNKGEGVPEDNAEAARWLRLAAEQGYASAQNSLGQLYSTGSGVPADATEALRWFRRAADQGYPIAQGNVGVAYATGRGAPQDDAEAVRWFRRAAEQGDDNGQYSLGVAYFRGAGAAKDDAEAARWFRRAAEQGNARAQFNLGAMYNNGAGVPEDYVIRVVGRRGSPSPSPSSWRDARRMSDTQIEDALSRANMSSLFLIHSTSLGSPRRRIVFRLGRWWNANARQRRQWGASHHHGQ